MPSRTNMMTYQISTPCRWTQSENGTCSSQVGYFQILDKFFAPDLQINITKFKLLLNWCHKCHFLCKIIFALIFSKTWYVIKFCLQSHFCYLSSHCDQSQVSKYNEYAVKLMHRLVTHHAHIYPFHIAFSLCFPENTFAIHFVSV